MVINERLIDDSEWQARLAAAVRGAFDRTGYSPCQTDLDTATQSLRIRLLRPMEHEEGRTMWADRFLRRTAWFCVLTYLAERHERAEGRWLLSLDALAQDSDDEASSELNRKLDPLYAGSLLRLGGEMDDVLRSAPYEVQFLKEDAEVSMYKRNPYSVPSFRIVAKGAEALRGNWRNGQRLRLSHEHVGYHGQQAIKDQRSRYATCLRRALPQYMHWLGVQGLKETDRKVILLVNREHLGDAEVKRRTGIPASTYNGIVGRLTRHGFEDCLNAKKERVFKYNPVLDSTQRYVSPREQSRILAMSVSEVLGESERLFDLVADSTRLDPDDIARLARSQRVELMTAKMGIDAIWRHDDRLRSFIRLSVESPAMGKNVSLEEVERILRATSMREARDLVFRSLRFQKPITELFSFTYAMRGELKKAA